MKPTRRVALRLGLVAAAIILTHQQLHVELRGFSNQHSADIAATNVFRKRQFYVFRYGLLQVHVLFQASCSSRRKSCRESR